MKASSAPLTWQIWVDTGGTFTDCLAIAPDGELCRAKVLSSSALRGCFAAPTGPRGLAYQASWRAPDGFAAGATVHWLDREAPPLAVIACAGSRQELELAGEPPQSLRPGEALELRFAEPAPVLAARLVTQTPASEPLPPVAMRLATTRGTNALLERRGARTVLFITRGFSDLLRIGNQQRPDLFALDIRRPEPLYDAVVEITERLAADGSVIEPLALDGLAQRLDELRAAGFESAAVALLHSYRQPVHEERLVDFLRQRGWRYVSSSARLAPLIKILPRAQTAVVNAYLAPIIETYLENVAAAVRHGRLHVMTSAGGLVGAASFEPKDSLLSGPAGGVVGAALCAREHGLERAIAFDMGGTSTDVARFDGDYEYLFEHQIGDATVASPALAIESVAAGGGSLCWLDEGQLKVGPQSAGADPGPACYGAGGPLTLTDVNLLLGRLDPGRFAIPIAPAAARDALDELAGTLSSTTSSTTRLTTEEILAGFLAIANERMADAIRRISVRRGYDPREYALVAFGGAGGLHACQVARLLGIERVLLPREAGLLSALGLGAAVIERFAQSQALAPLDKVGRQLADRLDELVEQAIGEVEAEGVLRSEIEVRRRNVFLRFAGQETALEVAADSGDELAEAFLRRYGEIYGYRPPQRPIEVESLRVVASSRRRVVTAEATSAESRPARAGGEQRAFFTEVSLTGSWRTVPTYSTADLRPGDRLVGPALVFDDHASLVVEEGWEGQVSASSSVLLRDRGEAVHTTDDSPSRYGRETSGVG